LRPEGRSNKTFSKNWISVFFTSSEALLKPQSSNLTISSLYEQYVYDKIDNIF
jgi:hypothetical protein